MEPLLEVESFVGIVMHVRRTGTIQHLRIGAIRGSESVESEARHGKWIELVESLKGAVEMCILLMLMLGIKGEETNIQCRHVRLLYVVPNAVMDILMVLRWETDEAREMG